MIFRAKQVAQQNSRKAKPDTPEYAGVKQGMVDAAITLIAERGLRKFRFEELAERVGCNRATIYRYFDSKDDLVTEVMMTLMREITDEIIADTAGTEAVTTQTFTDSLYKIITDLRTDPRYAVIMDSQNVASFARLTHEYFSAITTDMLEKYMLDAPAGRVLKAGVAMEDAVHWLMHQIISYGFLGLKGETEAQQKSYLETMVVSVIV